MFQIKLSETTAARRRIPILLVDATDGYTPETGITSPTIKISKNGATQATGTGTFTEIGTGQYYYEFASGEVDTLGWIAFNLQKSGTTRDYNAIVQIMAYDAMDVVRLGLTALPNAAAEALGGLATLSANQSSGGTIPANMVAISGDVTAADNLETAADGGVYNLGGGGIVASSVTNNVGGNVTGSVGSVTGNVGGNVVGSVASVTGSVNSVATGVTVGGFSAGAITSTAFANGAIQNAAINNGAISVNKIADGTITAAKFGTDAITSTVIAADAITSAELATSAVNEIVDAVWSANISTNSAAAAWANDTMGKRVLRSSSNTDATEAVVADAVWEEPRGDHDTGNTMGHSLDQIRKANYITEGTVNSTTGATTTSFRTNLTGVNDTYQHQTILFVNSVALNGQSAPILSYAQTNGVITLGDGLTVAPSLNDEFVILPTHVYPMSYIVTNILEGNTSTTSYAAGDVGNVLGRLANMIEADGADFRYTTNALEQAPSGGGGGGTTYVTGNLPYRVKADEQFPGGVVDINVGTLMRLDLQIVDRDDNPINLTGGTVTVGVRNASTGATVGTDQSATLSLARLGYIYVDTVADWSATAGTYRITVSATLGSDVIVAGPLQLIVRTR